MDSFVQQHAEDEMFFLSDPAVHDLIESSDSLRISDPGRALLGVRYGVDLYRASGVAYADVIDQVADEFWPWED